MTREEFIETLARALRSELSEQEVLDNVRYYETYFSQEMQKGKSGEQVAEQLGDPRLIARTILDVNRQREEQEEQGNADFYSDFESARTVYTEDPEGNYEEEIVNDGTPFEEDTQMHTFRLGGWKAMLILMAVLLVVFFILGTMFAIVWRLLPFILLGVILMWIYRRFFS